MSNTPKLVIAAGVWLLGLFVAPIVILIATGSQVALGFVFFEVGAGLLTLTCVAMAQIVKYLESRP